MEKQIVVDTIKNAAITCGFLVKNDDNSTLGIDIVDDDSIVSIVIRDELEINQDEKRIIHHIKVSASISKTAISKTVDDIEPWKLFMQAELMRNAARLCVALRNVDLSWAEQY